MLKIACMAGLLALSLSPSSLLQAQEPSALALVQRVADRVIRDTRFELQWKPQHAVLGMQVVDARFMPLRPGDTYIADATARVSKGDSIRFGINSANPVKIYINRALVYRQPAQSSPAPVEIAYDHFRFQQYFSVPVSPGVCHIRVESIRQKAAPLVFLRAVTSAGYLDSALQVSDSGWLYTGPLAAAPSPDDAFTTVVPGRLNRVRAPERLLPELVVDPGAAYQRDPYADWQYSHGILIWTIGRLGLLPDGARFHDFVDRYTGFTLQNLDYFRWQYDSLFAFRGSYHRIFRRTMLDDAGAPALPFALAGGEQQGRVATLGLSKGARAGLLNELLDSVLQYVRKDQPRLADGTFCRPEPIPYTVWCDDLFMSVPLLLQMAVNTGDVSLYDEAARQAVQFHRYLYNPANRLYAHGWFSTTRQRSPVSWGRANGWIAWATAELLERLPRQHPLYKTILGHFRQFMQALSACQAADGMWHQVLDSPGTYEETSCTAMFALAMARGVRLGWLPPRYKPVALKAWKAVAAHITADGVVKGICRGTDMGYDEQFYQQRKTIDNDPRGLGAVIMAGIEIAQLH